MTSAFRSVLAPQLAGYVRLKRLLGLRFEGQAVELRAFDRYLDATGFKPPLTQDVVLEYAKGDPQRTPMRVAQLYHHVRRFADYLRAVDPKAPRLDPKAIGHRQMRPLPHIYSDDEIRALEYQAGRLSAAYPILRATFRAIIGLGAASGLRTSEVVRLDGSTVDLERGLLVVVQGKFRKDRLVPIHDSVTKLLRGYARKRDRLFPRASTPAFFLNAHGARLSTRGFQGMFRSLAERAGLRSATGRTPRFHDLRHTFAVRRLVRWYEEGVDVQAKLPALATYMGHVHFTHTAYYITAIPELMALVGARFEKYQRLGAGS